VHSSTGLKIPLPAIAEMIQEINSTREEAERILLCVDGVHGFGNQDVTLDQLGCDFLAAGCHKWLFGPRGTGTVFASEAGWRRMVTHVPSFVDDGVFSVWIAGQAPNASVDGARLTLGGFKPFEHIWALPEAFELHNALGKDAIEQRTHDLATQSKEGLASLDGVVLATPRSSALSAVIVSFNIDGHSPDAVVQRRRERRIIASVAPIPSPGSA
jgi:selenocysteine lyase/cysteine desulfurase